VTMLNGLRNYLSWKEDFLYLHRTSTEDVVKLGASDWQVCDAVVRRLREEAQS